MQEILLATHNQHKAEELQQLLEGLYKVVTLAELDYHDDIPENEPTIKGNSLAKATWVKGLFNMPVIADDTGLEVASLNGAPGVHSARYAGEDGNSTANVNKLLAELEGNEDRSARFLTVITLLDGEETHFFEGICEGEITSSPSGKGGFGYDPVFRPKGYTLTFAELAPSEKNAISHRGRAAQQLIAHLQSKA